MPIPLMCAITPRRKTLTASYSLTRTRATEKIRRPHLRRTSGFNDLHSRSSRHPCRKIITTTFGWSDKYFSTTSKLLSIISIILLYLSRPFQNLTMKMKCKVLPKLEQPARYALQNLRRIAQYLQRNRECIRTEWGSYRCRESQK